jgi:prophage tail gpP-like protein
MSENRLECWVAWSDGTSLTLPGVIRWQFEYGTGTPCDSFTVRCLWAGGQEKLLTPACRFYAQWKGERVFTGVVDEFAVCCGEDGRYLELSGRGLAALLLDNEALPMEYQRATRADIVADHVTPYGIETVGGSALPAVSGFTVDSGASEWSVVQEFACYYGGVVPRFDRLGRLVLDGHRDEETLLVGSGDGVTAWEYREERHGVLSQVAVRRRSGGTVQWVSDPAFLAQGGQARRVITVPNTTGTEAMRYSADYQLRAARSGRVRLTLTLAGAFLAWPGQLVEVDLPDCGANGSYRVAQVEVNCNDKGLSTTLTLGETDSMI